MRDIGTEGLRVDGWGLERWGLGRFVGKLDGAGVQAEQAIALANNKGISIGREGYKATPIVTKVGEGKLLSCDDAARSQCCKLDRINGAVPDTAPQIYHGVQPNPTLY